MHPGAASVGEYSGSAVVEQFSLEVVQYYRKEISTIQLTSSIVVLHYTRVVNEGSCTSRAPHLEARGRVLDGDVGG